MTCDVTVGLHYTNRIPATRVWLEEQAVFSDDEQGYIHFMTVIPAASPRSSLFMTYVLR